MALRRLGSQACRRRAIRCPLQSFLCSDIFPSSGFIRGVAEEPTDDFGSPVLQFLKSRHYLRRRETSHCGSAFSANADAVRIDEIEDQKRTAKPAGTGEGYTHFEPRRTAAWRKFPVAGGLGYARPGAGPRWFSSPTRICDHALQTAVSHATASRYSKEDEEKEVQKVKAKKAEASAEDCDQAVVGLSSAKAKMKQAQEPPKKNDVSMLTKFWNIVVGIGPAMKAVASMSREDWAIKIAGWKKSFRAELQHYWVGTKLLWADVRISVRLMSKLAGGKSLSRRERQQLTRTTADIFRLVPFAVFIIVPFMELLLPVFLKLFPNMLPSTFQDKMKEQEELKKRLNARIQYAKFLQETVGEMAKELKTTRSGDLQKSAKDLFDFMSKVRKGVDVTNEEILAFAKLFNDELTLDNISRPRLVSMCKYMGIQPYGTDAYLRYSLRTKLAWIKADDRLIQKEGVESLSESELRSACRERGMLGLVSVSEMQQQLRDWLDLSLNHSVPSSLLILSRSFVVTGRISREDAIEAALSSLPEEVVDSVQAAVPSEDALAEAKRKLELLHEQEKLIKEEAAKELEEQQKLKMEAGKAYEQTLDVISAKDARDMAKIKADEKQEQLCKISSALAILASASSVSNERADFLNLVNSEIQLYNSMVEKEGTADEEQARRAYRAAREDSDRAAEAASGSKVSSALIGRIDAMLHKLEKDLDDVDAKIGDRWKILDRDSDGKVTPEEVATAAMFLKDTLGQGPLQELISNLAKDPDGKILVEDIVKLGAVADMKDSHENEERLQRQFS